MENTAFFYYDNTIATNIFVHKEPIEVVTATSAKHWLSGLKNEKRNINRDGVIIAGQIVISGAERIGLKKYLIASSC